MENRANTLSGIVIDKFTKNPLTFAKVTIREIELEATCDKDGKYLISEIPTGIYKIEAIASGYNKKVENVSILKDIETTVDFPLIPIGFFDLKEKTPFYTKLSFIGALVAIIIACIVIPEVEIKPYNRKVDAAIQAIELPPQLKQLEEAPPPPKPKMPVEAESDDEVEASTIDRTDFTGIEKQPPQAKTEEIYEYMKVEVKPKLLMEYYVEPEYPPFAKKAEIEGQVLLRFLVNEEGRVIDIKIVKSLNELLNAAAIKAVSKWRYSPARQRDKPVKVWVVQPVRFELDK